MYFEKTIDQTAGVLEITDLESQAFGAKIIILPDALTENKKISISTGVTFFDTPANYISAGQQINLGPGGLLFEKTIIMSIPYSDTDNDGFIDGTAIPEDKVQLIYFNEQTSEWEKIEILNRDYMHNIVEAETDHFSTYLVAIDEVANNDQTDCDTTVFRTGESFLGNPELTIIDPEEDH